MGLKTFIHDNLPLIYQLLLNSREIVRRRKIIKFNEFDLDEIHKCVGKKNPIIIDIGTNDGGEIVDFLQQYPESTVYAVEADPEPFKRLQKRFSGDNRVKCFNMAIADTNGRISFNCSSGFLTEEQKRTNVQHDYSGSILAPKLHLELAPGVKFEKKIDVTCMTLDSFLESHDLDMPDFIWMDVQGAEFNVFKGGTKTLKNVKAIYTEYGLVEYYEGQKNLWFIADFLKQFGFRLKTRFPCDALFCK